MPPLRHACQTRRRARAVTSGGRGAARPRHAADANGGIAKAFFPTEAARAGHYRDLDIILGQLMGRKSFGEVLELGASGGAWTWGLAHDDRVRRLYATETSPAALSHLADITADGAALVLETCDRRAGHRDGEPRSGGRARRAQPGGRSHAASDQRASAG
jgi:hypothetical protein